MSYEIVTKIPGSLKNSLINIVFQQMVEEIGFNNRKNKKGKRSDLRTGETILINKINEKYKVKVNRTQIKSLYRAKYFLGKQFAYFKIPNTVCPILDVIIDLIQENESAKKKCREYCIKNNYELGTNYESYIYLLVLLKLYYRSYTANGNKTRLCFDNFYQIDCVNCYKNCFDSIIQFQELYNILKEVALTGEENSESKTKTRSKRRPK